MMVLVTGCGKKGSLNPLERPEIFITSYEGVEDTEDIAEEPYLFQKRIYWRGESKGGTVEGYAYRVLDADNVPIRTPKTLIDADGWIYHYKPGADQSIPLTNPDVRTIWTNKVFDVINFPASVDGDSSNVVSIFEVKCKDNYDQESLTAKRYFNVTGSPPDFDVIFAGRFFPLKAASLDLPENERIYKTVGLGFDVSFLFTEHTPYTPSVPNYYMFRLEKRNVVTGELIPGSEKPADGTWYDTSQQKNVSSLWLTMEGDNQEDFAGRDDVFFVLNPDEFENNNPSSPKTRTHLIAKAVSLGNIHSPNQTAQFSVYENFEPSALVYERRTVVLGRNHFTTFQDDSLQRPLPEQQSPVPGEGTQYGTPFFLDKDGDLAALYSPDLKIYLRWGWKGQFDNNDPDQGFINEVHDNVTSIDYLATVKAFDLRLDGDFYNYPPLVQDPDKDYIFEDPDGTKWLRVPRFHPIDTRALLTDVTPGEHHFVVRVLDSQNKTSPPVDFSFYIKERIPEDQKEGILIVADEVYAGALGYINEATNTFYDYIVSEYSGPVETLNRNWLKNNVWDPRLHYGRNVVSPTDLESYRLVIWHCDFPTDVGASTNFHEDFDTINLFMRGNGNMLLSAGQNLRNIHTQSRDQGFYNFLFERYFGIPFQEADAILRLSQAFTSNPYFIGADNAPGSPLNLPGIDLNLQFHPILPSQGGLGPVAYFNFDLIDDPNVETIYTMRTTEAGAAYEGEPVAIRRITDNNKTYMFGFPLSYMDQDQVKGMLNLIIDDIGL
jgi:hypothetical protein